jgi:predicted NBD/HSP70 family sugar kinase
MLQARPGARNVITLDLSDPQTMRAAVIDLAGSVLFDVKLDSQGADGDEALERIEAAVAEALEHACAPVLGIGVGTPGVVTPDGVVKEAWHFGWHHVELAARLEGSFGYPVHVSNDANAAAIAEYTRGGHDVSNLAVIKIGSGVGAGFVLGGLPYRGEHSGAGEIGHLVVDVEGPPCRCGHRGCLETFVAVPNIEAALAEQGAEPTAVRHAAAGRLGVALAAIVAILDIDHVLVSGPRDLLGADFCDVAADSLRERCLQSTAASVCVAYSSLGGDVVLLGAAGLVLSQELGVA